MLGEHDRGGPEIRPVGQTLVAHEVRLADQVVGVPRLLEVQGRAPDRHIHRREDELVVERGEIGGERRNSGHQQATGWHAHARRGTLTARTPRRCLHPR